ncbi:putative dienelactone hydrolase [Janthinobacterium sp. HH01]|uniref:dienelactone hydrolase family protein n=1 Tax=Janthinobacterium sp. HH01 TaxID=1198452 RepID=UPI0002AED72F|nr:dienelactone hydrolase family protein [Janthinobacterium sp. HH01]ELX13919.1 putative dienelactone hydrolase [Janthinobacterium sp. HH01]
MTFKTFLAALLVVAAQALPSAHAQDPTSDRHNTARVYFDSYTPATMYDLAREQRQNWMPQTVWGQLTFPPTKGKPVPAMVIMHGSAGIEANTQMWVGALNGIGVATFVVSSYEPRGISSTVNDQSLLSQAANLMDGLQALQLLAADRRIDPERIGVMGFSRGGAVAFRTAIEPLRHAVIKSDVKFALHIPLYAGCNQIYWSRQITGAPILNLLGAADDYTGAAPCEREAALYQEAGADIRTIKYDGAYHSFDATYKLKLLPNAPTTIPCGVVRWEIDSWTIYSELSGAIIPPAALPDFYKPCTKYGVHVGRNAAAVAQARTDVLAFVQEIFFGAKSAELAPAP